MKIFLVSNMYPSAEYPNYGVFVKNTEEILKEEGWKVEKAVLHKSNSQLKKLASYFSYYLKIMMKGIFSSYDVTYVHYASHNALPLIVLKKIRKKTRIFTNVHGSDVVPEVKSQEKYQPYVNQLLQLSDKVITPSSYYKNLIIKKYGLNGAKVFVFPSGGVNNHVFYRDENMKDTLEELGLDQDYKYIGFVGRLDVGKGWEVALKAIKKVKDLGFLKNRRLIVVGKGAQQQRYEELVQELDLQSDIVYFPLLPQKQLNQIYNCLELFCFPTTREGESLGLVGLEAMACGIPVIGSRIGGLLDYMQDGVNGYLFEPGSDEDLKQKLIKFFTLSEAEKLQMQKEAFITAENYEVKKIKPILIDIFRKN